jgi:6-phosphofructokinase 1
VEASKFIVENLGPANFENPLSKALGDEKFVIFTSDEKRILLHPHTSALDASSDITKLASFEIAGPRKELYFDPPKAKVAIVTCGGLCPGLNSVIRSLVMQLSHRYGCQNIYGIKFGYGGLGKNHAEFVKLTPDDVIHIHERGGTILGSSRGSPPVSEMVDTLEEEGIDILITIGGDGTMRGALALLEETQKRGLKISIVGVPKTIDNDIPYVRRSFGFETAVGIASTAIHSAHVEAQDAPNGLGIVKLMGRHSGYIAASATLATGHANYCLIPEVDFSLEGKGGLLELVEERIKTRGHCVLVIAEGCGQYYFDQEGSVDASGNKQLVNIGRYIRDRMGTYFSTSKTKASIKYIDPSYMIRAASANSADQLFCNRLAQNTIHAAMAGKTGLLIGYWHGQMTHVPISSLKGQRQNISPRGELWFNVLETTGQPANIGKLGDVKREKISSVWLN